MPVSPEEKERWKDDGPYYAPEEEEEIAPIQHADWTDMTLRTLSEVDPDWAENLALETPEVLETDPPGHDPWAVTPDEMDIDESLDPADSQEVEPDYPYAAAQPPQSWDDPEAQDGAFDAADEPEEAAQYGTWPAHYEEAQAVHRRRRSVRESRRAGRSRSMGGEEVQHHQPKHMDARPARLVVPAPEKDWKGTGYAKPLKRKRLLSLSGEEEEAVSGLPPMPVEGAAFHAAAMPDGTRRRQDDEYDSGR